MKNTRDHERIHTRKIDRSVAHAKMKTNGIQHINKSKRMKYTTVTGATLYEIEPSYFAKNWRAYAQ